MAEGILPSGVLIGYGSVPYHGRLSGLTLQDATVPAGTTIDAGVVLGNGPQLPASLQFAGAVVNDGTFIIGGGVQSTLPSGTTLTNNGTIDVYKSAQLNVGAAGITVTNDGLIRVLSPGGHLLYPVVLMPAIGGTGTISVSVNTGLELGNAVGRGQTLQFVGGGNANASVQIDQPSLSAARIGGFVPGDTLTLANTASTSVGYVATGAGSGTLQIYDGGSAPVAALQFSGVYAASNFSLSESGSSLVITTNVTNASTGSTAALTSSGIYPQSSPHFGNGENSVELVCL